MKTWCKTSIAAGALAAFVLWTYLVGVIDVQAIGPRESTVGFATLNEWVHALTGVHMTMYTITDWLGLVPIAIAAGFGVLGLVQWICRRNITKVDADVLLLGGFYLAVIAVYILFENVVINYRPVLIEGYLEVSYPSSTTMLVMCVMPTAMMQWHARVRHRTVRGMVLMLAGAFAVFMVVGRVIAGVHWITDIIGGALISTALVMGYAATMKTDKKKS